MMNTATMFAIYPQELRQLLTDYRFADTASDNYQKAWGLIQRNAFIERTTPTQWIVEKELFLLQNGAIHENTPKIPPVIEKKIEQEPPKPPPSIAPHCLACNAPLAKSSKTAKFCSDACRKKAWKLEHKKEKTIS